MATSKTPPQGTIGPTRVSVLLGVLAVSGVLGYAFASISELVSHSAPRVEWVAVAAPWAIAAMLGVLAGSTYKTLHRDRRRLPSRQAVNLLTLAKASALVGAVLAGGYLGFGLNFIDRLDIPLPRDRAVRSLIASVAGLAMVVCALLLERACRVPKDLDA